MSFGAHFHGCTLEQNEKYREIVDKANKIKKMTNLTLKLPRMTKTEFHLTIFTQHQPDKRWEKKKNINLGIIGWSNTKFSEITL